MKMKKADEAHAAKAEKMKNPDFHKYSGWPPVTPAVTAQKVANKLKRVVDEIKKPLSEADGDSAAD